MKPSTLELSMAAQLDQATDVPPYVTELQFDKRREPCVQCLGEGTHLGVIKARVKCKPCNGKGSRVTGRGWRFDFAWPELRIALEVDGGTWSGGRHGRGGGMEKDSEKFSEAAIAGWRIIRVTGKHVKNGTALRWVQRVMEATR